MLQLESPLRHVMGFTPLLDSGDVVLDLHGWKIEISIDGNTL